MSSSTLSIETSIFCEKCGDKLEALLREANLYGQATKLANCNLDIFELVVLPCDTCLRAEYQRGVDETEEKTE